MSIYRHSRFNPCDFITEYSEDVWDRLRTVQATAGTQQRIRYDETTVTQEMVYLFNRLTTGGRVHFFERNDEPVSGADLELRIVSNSTNFGFHAYIQSKRVYNPNQTYTALQNRHGQIQIDRLINHQAHNNIGALPMYLFYNYHPDAHCNRNPKDYGLTIAPANSIKNRFGIVNGGNLTGWTHIPSFELFHITNQNFCRPFSILFCPNLLRYPYLGLPFPFNIPSLIFDTQGILDVIREVRVNEILNTTDITSVLTKLIEGNYGIVDSLMFKEELKERGVQIKISVPIENSIDSMIKSSSKSKSNWLEGFSKYETNNVQKTSEIEEEQSSNNEFKAKYKIVFVLD